MPHRKLKWEIRNKVLTRYEAEILRAAIPDVLGRAGTGI